MTSILPKSLVLAPFDPVELENLKNVTEVTYESWMETRKLVSPEELIERIQGQDISILVIEADFVFDEVFEAADNLRFVGICRGSTDNVDIEAATRQRVTVVNAPARNAVSVAELTIGLIVSLARNISAAHSLVKAGEWTDPVGPYISMRGTELAGKTAGIIGFGAVGREVAKRLNVFDMKIIAYDPYVNYERETPGIEFVELEKLMADSDFITIHCPVTPETEGMVDESRLNLMKPTAFLINMARWEIIKTAPLLKVLSEKRIAGAAFDVFETHPLTRSSPLMSLDNVLLTPHIGGATDGVITRYSRMMAEDIRRFLRGQKPLNQINPEVTAQNVR